MKVRVLIFPAAALLLAGCGWGDSAHRNEPKSPGEGAGKTAYYVQKDAKKAVKELGHDLKSFSRDAHEGYKEAQQRDRARHEQEKRDPQQP